MAESKFSRDEYAAMLKMENISNEYAMAAVNAHFAAIGRKPIEKISEADLYLYEVMAIIRITAVPRAISPIDIARILRRLNMTAEIATARMVAYADQYRIPEKITHLMQWPRSLIELEAALCGYTTFNNIPVSLIRNQMKRPYPDAAYKEKKATGIGLVETLDPRVIRLRLNEVFGPPGVGWRVAAIETVSTAHVDTYKERKSDGSEGRDMVQVRGFGFCGEYAVRDLRDYSLSYVRTNIIIDGWHMADFEAAGSGAGTAFFKEIARLMGGMDETESKIELVLMDD